MRKSVLFLFMALIGLAAHCVSAQDTDIRFNQSLKAYAPDVKVVPVEHPVPLAPQTRNARAAHWCEGAMYHFDNAFCRIDKFDLAVDRAEVKNDVEYTVHGLFPSENNPSGSSIKFIINKDGVVKIPLQAGPYIPDFYKFKSDPSVPEGLTNGYAYICDVLTANTAMDPELGKLFPNTSDDKLRSASFYDADLGIVRVTVVYFFQFDGAELNSGKVVDTLYPFELLLLVPDDYSYVNEESLQLGNWDKASVVDYTDCFLPSFGFDERTYKVKLQQNTMFANTYRIFNPFENDPRLYSSDYVTDKDGKSIDAAILIYAFDKDKYFLGKTFSGLHIDGLTVDGMLASEFQINSYVNYMLTKGSTKADVLALNCIENGGSIIYNGMPFGKIYNNYLSIPEYCNLYNVVYSFDGGNTGSGILITDGKSHFVPYNLFKLEFDLNATTTDPIEIPGEIYVSGVGTGLGTAPNNLLSVTASADGSYEFDINNLESFSISTSNTSMTDFEANAYTCSNVFGSSLGNALILSHGSEPIRVPWKGDYHIVVDKSLSTITLTTTTPRPANAGLYLRGSFNDWACTDQYKFSVNNDGSYTFVMPADISGEWKIGSPDWLYSYGYSGGANPNGLYTMTYNGYNSTVPLKEGDTLRFIFDADVYTTPATLTVIAKADIPTPPVGDTQTQTLNGVTYTIYPAEGVFDATDGKNARGDIELIQTMAVSGKTCTLRSVAAGAFAGNGSLTAITIPAGATTIGDNAFNGCEYLHKVKLPASLTTIGDYAFLDCTYLAEFTLPDNMSTLGVGVFRGCTDLYSFNFKNAALTEIPASLFEGCMRLSEVRIPTTVKTIGASAFENSGVTKIGETKSVTTVSDRAFAGSKLGAFDFSDVVTAIGVSSFEGTALTSAILPASVTRLGAEAFKDCAKLNEVQLPSSITTVPTSLFENCVYLHSIDIPTGVKAIEAAAFKNSGLVTIVVPDGVTELGKESLSSETLVSVTIGTGVTSLSNTPVNTHGTLRLKSATPPLLSSERLGCYPAIVLVPKGSGDTYLESNRWRDYPIVEENGHSGTVWVKNAGELAKEITAQLRVMPAQVTNLTVRGILNDNDFRVIKSNMTSCYSIDLSGIDNTVIPANAFKDKLILNEFILPSKLETIEESAFEGCSLLNIGGNIPSTLTAIGDNAFAGCYSLSTQFTLSSSFNTLGEGVFTDCYSLKGIDLSKSQIKAIPTNTFANCINLETITLNGQTTEIGDKAFMNSGLRTISMPESLRTVGISAFEGCTSLTAVTLPDGLTSLGERAFAESGIVYMQFPDALTDIADETLAGCNNLLVVNFPSELKSLGSRAVASPSVSAMSSPAIEPAFTGYRPFDGVNNNTCALSIPGFSFTEYINAEYWGAFVDLRNDIDVALDKGVNVTYMDEEDYMTINKKQAPAYNVANLASRADLLGIMRSNGAVSDNTGYGRLFDGAKLYCSDNSLIRFFFEIEPNTIDYKVYYNNQDITKEIDTVSRSWLAPAFTSSATLKVSAIQSVESVFEMSSDEADVYNLQGYKVLSKATADDIRSLAPGIYILKSGASARKICVSTM